MKLTWVEKWKIYWFQCNYDEKEIPKSKHFRWQPKAKVWYTKDYRIANALINYADEKTKELINKLYEIEKSLPKVIKEPRKKPERKPKYDWTITELMDPEYNRYNLLQY